MQFTVEKSKIVHAIGQAARVVERRNTIPILSNVLLIADGDSLRMKTTDLDMEFSISIPANVSVGGQTTVSALLLNDIVKKLGGTEINFELDKKQENYMSVGSGRSKFNLYCLPAIDMPDITVGNFSNEFEIKSADLKKLIDRTQFAISTEETRYYLNGIFLHVATNERGEDKLRAVTTDGHRLALCDTTMPDGAHGMPGVIIPRKTVGEFNNLLALGENAKLEVSDSKIRLTIGVMVLTSKLIDGTFPDYQRVIPTGGNKVAIFDTKLVSAASDRVSVVSSERGRAVKLTFADNQMRLEVNNPDSGRAEDCVDIQFDADEMDVGFNNRYLQDILGNITSKSARMTMSDAGSPTIFTDEEGDDTLYVLMPMRV